MTPVSTRCCQQKALANPASKVASWTGLLVGDDALHALLAEGQGHESLQGV
jgi:hypothetical protein